MEPAFIGDKLSAVSLLIYLGVSANVHGSEMKIKCCLSSLYASGTMFYHYSVICYWNYGSCVFASMHSLGLLNSHSLKCQFNWWAFSKLQFNRIRIYNLLWAEVNIQWMCKNNWQKGSLTLRCVGAKFYFLFNVMALNFLIHWDDSYCYYCVATHWCVPIRKCQICFTDKIWNSRTVVIGSRDVNDFSDNISECILTFP